MGSLRPIELHIVNELTGPLSPYFSVSTLSFLCRSGVRGIVDYNLLNFTIKLCFHDSIHTGFIQKDVVDVKINSLFSNSNIQSLFLIYQIFISQFIYFISVHLSIHISTHLSSITRLSFNLPSTHTFIHSSIISSAYTSILPSMPPSTHFPSSINPFILPSKCPFIIHPCIHLSPLISIGIHLTMCWGILF